MTPAGPRPRSTGSTAMTSQRAPLAGVPLTVKEDIDVAGSATTFGVPHFHNLIVGAEVCPERKEGLM